MTEEERYESFAETRPRLAAALSGSFSVYDDQESDDFVVIDLVNSEKETPSSSPNPTAPSSPASPSEAKKELEYDDYVELFIDDANETEVRPVQQKRALYGLRLYHYSAESEGNIYITDDQL